MLKRTNTIFAAGLCSLFAFSPSYAGLFDDFKREAEKAIQDTVDQVNRTVDNNKSGKKTSSAGGSGDSSEGLSESSSSLTLPSNDGVAPVTPYVHILMALKYMPNIISNQDMLKITKFQIREDQREYRNRENTHKPLFSRKQVVGRDLNFAAEDLAPVMREKLQVLANKLPDRFIIEYQLADFPKYDRGAGLLRVVEPRLYGSKNKVRHFIGTPYKPNRGGHKTQQKSLNGKMMVPTGIRHKFNSISVRGWQNSGYVGIDRINTLLNRGGLDITLAFDRLLEYDGVPMSRSQAEKLIVDNQKLRRRRNHDNVARIEFSVTRGEKGKKPGDYNALIAKVHKVTIMRFDGKVFASLPGSKFAMGPVSTSTAKVATKTRTKKRPSGPYGQKILGLQLGMKMTDAVAQLQRKMEVSERYETDKANQNSGEPYKNMKVFISEKSSELVALYGEPGATDKVIGIVRRIGLQKGYAFGTELADQLQSQYGKPLFRKVRTNSGSTTGNMTWGKSKKEVTQSCESQAGAFNTIEKTSLIKEKNKIPRILANIPLPKLPVFVPGKNKWKKCGPAFNIQWSSGKNISTLDFSLVDQGAYYDYMMKSVKAAKAANKKNKVNITF